MRPSSRPTPESPEVSRCRSDLGSLTMMKRADHHPQKGRNGLAMSAKATPTPPKSEGFPMTKATSTAKEATEKGRDGLILAYICHVCHLQRTKADGFPMS